MLSTLMYSYKVGKTLFIFDSVRLGSKNIGSFLVSIYSYLSILVLCSNCYRVNNVCIMQARSKMQGIARIALKLGQEFQSSKFHFLYDQIRQVVETSLISMFRMIYVCGYIPSSVPRRINKSVTDINRADIFR